MNFTENFDLSPAQLLVIVERLKRRSRVEDTKGDTTLQPALFNDAELHVDPVIVSSLNWESGFHRRSYELSRSIRRSQKKSLSSKRCILGNNTWGLSLERIRSYSGCTDHDM